MELIQEIKADEIKLRGYSFLSYNTRGFKTTAYYVSDTNKGYGIGLSLYTSGSSVTINVSTFNLFYNDDSTFDEAYVAGYGGIVEEDRQKCIELLNKAKELIPNKYSISLSSNITLYVLGGK